MLTHVMSHRTKDGTQSVSVEAPTQSPATLAVTENGQVIRIEIDPGVTLVLVRTLLRSISFSDRQETLFDESSLRAKLRQVATLAGELETRLDKVVKAGPDGHSKHEAVRTGRPFST